MPFVISVRPETENLIRHFATAQGLPVEEYLSWIIEQTVAQPSTGTAAPTDPMLNAVNKTPALSDDWEAMLRSIGIEHAATLTDDQTRRENIYED